MGRTSKNETWRHFDVVSKGSKKEATCKYCKRCWGNALVTRLTDHINNDCQAYKDFCDNEMAEDDPVEEVQPQDTQDESSNVSSAASASASATSNLSGTASKLDSQQKKMKHFLDTMSKG